MHLHIPASTAIAVLAFLLRTASALTFTSPTAGSIVDGTQPFTITWTTTATDPSTITLHIANTDSSLTTTSFDLANNVPTSSGSYTVPRLSEYGTAFVVQALSGPGGSVIATSGTFTFTGGSAAATTLANGETSYVLTTTAEATSTGAASASSLAPTATPASITGSVTTDAVTSSESLATTSTSSHTGLSTAISKSVSHTMQLSSLLGSSSKTAATSSTSTGIAIARPSVGMDLVFGAAGAVAGAVALLI